MVHMRGVLSRRIDIRITVPEAMEVLCRGKCMRFKGNYGKIKNNERKEKN